MKREFLSFVSYGLLVVVLVSFFSLIGNFTGFVGLSDLPYGPSTPGSPEEEVVDGDSGGGDLGVVEDGKCQNECWPLGIEKNVTKIDAHNSPGAVFQICGDYDYDDCLEWSSDAYCPNIKTRYLGSCILPYDYCVVSDWEDYKYEPAICPYEEEQTVFWKKKSGVRCLDGVDKPASEIATCTFNAPVCTSYSYSGWGICNRKKNGGKIREGVYEGVQYQSVVNVFPEHCDKNKIGSAEYIEERSCEYFLPACAEDDWDWEIEPGACPYTGKQTYFWEKNTECYGGVNHPVSEIVNCNFSAPTCVNFSYSDWSLCDGGGVQKRLLLTKGPEHCEGGNVELSRECDGGNYKNEFSDLNVFFENGKFIVNSSGKSFLEISADNFSGQGRIVEGREIDLGFVFVSLDENYFNKKIYLEVKSDSKGVCVFDGAMENLESLKSDCVYISCPGSFGNYSCERVSENFVGVSGLKHSAVYEMMDNFCGDGVCTNLESCESCSVDCGSCERAEGGQPGGGGSSGGGSSGSSGGNADEDVGFFESLFGGESDGENVTENISDVVNEEGKANVSSGLSEYWYVWVGGSAVVIALLLIFILIAVKIKRNVKQVEEGEKKNLSEEVAPQIAEIRKLLKKGKGLVERGEVVGGKRIYEKINEKYSALNEVDKSSGIYDEILEFYNSLVG